MHILDFSTVSYQKYQFYIIPIKIIYEDAILNFYFESKCACLAAMLDSISGHVNCWLCNETASKIAPQEFNRMKKT
jgi:ACT domain-containing protein